MVKRNFRLGIFWIVLMLVLGAFALPGTTSAEEVVYAMDITDPEGDSEGTLTQDEGVATDADIIKVTSVKDGDYIVLTMQVSGNVYINGTTYTTGYQFNIDINGDNVYDWLVSITSLGNYQGTNAQIQDDFAILYYLDNATTNGNDTVTVRFLLSYISDTETIDSWNIYGKSSVVKTGTMISYLDLAPDDGFETGGSGGNGDDGDTDDDGMPDDWEVVYGLDPNDPLDAFDDDDSDGYTNLEEYEALTDPTDETSTPDDGGGNGGSDGGVNPSTETPTDTTITVEISEAKFSVNKKGEVYEVDVLIKGTTSGVDHCLIILISTYEDGSTDSDYEWEEAFDMEEDPTMKQYLEDMGYTHSHFKDTSGGNWKSWEYRITGTINASDYENPEDPGPEPTKVKVYLRAFQDDAESKWNQDSKEVNVKMDDGIDKKDDDDDGFPGFGTTLVLISFVTAMVIASATIRKRR